MGTRMLRHRGCQAQRFAFTNTRPSLRTLRSIKLRASSNDGDDDLKQKFFGGEQPSTSQPKGAEKPASDFTIDNVNPYALGRQARAAFDDLWTQVTRVAQPTRSYIFDDVLQPEEESAQYANTTVLVIGATGRVGRILTRKLLLRGYKVKALVRRRDSAKEGADGVPEAVELVEGDVGESKDIQAAMRGVDKASALLGALARDTRLARCDCWRATAAHRTADGSRRPQARELAGRINTGPPSRRSSSVRLLGAPSRATCSGWRTGV